MLLLSRACPGLFIWGKTDGPKANSGGGFIGEGAATLSSYGSAQRISTIFNTQDGLS